MKIKFIKDHPVGIKKGSEYPGVADAWAKDMIEQGFAEEVKAKVIKKEKKSELKTKDKK